MIMSRAVCTPLQVFAGYPWYRCHCLNTNSCDFKEEFLGVETFLCEIKGTCEAIDQLIPILFTANAIRLLIASAQTLG